MTITQNVPPLDPDMPHQAGYVTLGGVKTPAFVMLPSASELATLESRLGSQVVIRVLELRELKDAYDRHFEESTDIEAPARWLCWSSEFEGVCVPPPIVEWVTPDKFKILENSASAYQLLNMTEFFGALVLCKR
jgi:hypothetical protein